jgi:hypothetical protein
MRHALRVATWLVFDLVLFAPVTGAQTAPPQKSGAGCVGIDSIGAATDNPFSAWRITRSVMFSPDGSKKVNTLAEKVARDSAGRIRVERMVKVSPDAPESSLAIGDGETANIKWDPSSTFISITDCATGEVIWTQPNAMIARMRSIGSGATLEQRNRSYRSASSTFLGRPHSPDLVAEALGSKQIGGVVAEGVRVTTLGTDDWSGKPIQITESWASVELAATIVEIRKRLKDGGESKQALVEIKRVEPDSSLFEIPPGYKFVRDFESGEPIPERAPRQ